MGRGHPVGVPSGAPCSGNESPSSPAAINIPQSSESIPLVLSELRESFIRGNPSDRRRVDTMKRSSHARRREPCNSPAAGASKLPKSITKQVCYAFVRGYCSDGDMCPYNHEPARIAAFRVKHPHFVHRGPPAMSPVPITVTNTPISAVFDDVDLEGARHAAVPSRMSTMESLVVRLESLGEKLLMGLAAHTSAIVESTTMLSYVAGQVESSVGLLEQLRAAISLHEHAISSSPAPPVSHPLPLVQVSHEDVTSNSSPAVELDVSAAKCPGTPVPNVEHSEHPVKYSVTSPSSVVELEKLAPSRHEAQTTDIEVLQRKSISAFPTEEDLAAAQQSVVSPTSGPAAVVSNDHDLIPTLGSSTAAMAARVFDMEAPLLAPVRDAHWENDLRLGRCLGAQDVDDDAVVSQVRGALAAMGASRNAEAPTVRGPGTEPHRTATHVPDSSM